MENYFKLGDKVCLDFKGTITEMALWSGDKIRVKIEGENSSIFLIYADELALLNKPQGVTSER